MHTTATLNSKMQWLMVPCTEDAPYPIRQAHAVGWSRHSDTPQEIPQEGEFLAYCRNRKPLQVLIFPTRVGVTQIG